MAKILKISEPHKFKTIMANKKQTANASRQAKATFTISDYQFNKAVALFVKEHLSGAREMTKNGALKLTTSRPECKEDIKNTVSIDGKTFYLVPASPNVKGVISALASYCDYLEAVRIQAKKQSNTKKFDEWVTSSEAKFKVDALEFAGIEVTDEMLRGLYAKYLKDRGVSE